MILCIFMPFKEFKGQPWAWKPEI